ncbi:MAG: phosphoribosylanthranilate isomerase [Thermoanaerobaculia bacterium]
MDVAVKICGITRREDAELAVELGAEFVGLNFWPHSPRCVTAEAALEIAERVRHRAGLVGVFVDEEPERVATMAEAVGLDLVQLHGNEKPSDAERLGPRVLKAFRGLPSAGEPKSFGSAWGFLVDVAGTGPPGGTGRSWAWSTGDLRESGKPVFVAGGIRPENAAEAAACGAFGIDVCSGVESAPGRKDAERMRALFRAVGRA